MKRILTLILCAAMLISCIAATAYAEPSDAAQNVIEQIASLDENATPEQLSNVVAAYEALSKEDKAEVWNYSKIEEIEQTHVDQIINDIDALGDLAQVSYFHHQKTVDKLFEKYNALSNASKAKVTNIDALIAAKAKIDATIEWTANKSVNILNETLAAFADYTLDDMYGYLEQRAMGIYYYFEEVGYLDVGDPTTGYFDLENDNEFVENYKYAKLDMDVIVTDLDFEAGWPALKFLVCNSDTAQWSGFEFVNDAFFQGKITRWGQGAFSSFSVYEPGEFSLGKWHHLTVLYDNETIQFTLDGNVVFETQYDDTYTFLIFYPWLCNLEMTNVVFTNRYGKETLSPFRTHINTPTGWSLGSNDSDSVMLDHIEESVDYARTAYNALSEDDKALVVGAEQIDRVQSLIDAARAGKREVVVENGSADVTLALPGETVTLTANEPEDGMIFDRWIAGEDSGVEFSDETSVSATFVMPGKSVQISATYKEAPKFIPFDINNDGKINSRDVIALMKAVLVGTTVDELPVADVNEDGKINSRDVIAMMKKVLEQ